VPDAVETLDVALDGPAEESGVHRLVLADRHVGQVRDRVELVVQKLKTFFSVISVFST
jgi:hypothetical protein